MPLCKELSQRARLNFTKSVLKPSEPETIAILNLKPPTTLKKLRSFVESAIHLSNFIPDQEKLCHLIRPLLKNSEKYIWTKTTTYTLKKSKTG